MMKNKKGKLCSSISDMVIRVLAACDGAGAVHDVAMLAAEG